MSIQPIFEKLSVKQKNEFTAEPIRVESKTNVGSETVSEVLSVSALANITNAEAGEGQVKYTGRATFYICYLSSDKTLKKTECVTDFSGAVNGAVNPGCKVIATAQVSKTDFDLSMQTLNALGVVNVTITTFIREETSALSGGEGLVIDTEEIALIKSITAKDGIYPLEEEFELNFEAQEVLSHSVIASISAVQCGVGSIIVDGQAILTLIVLQKNEKCSIIKEIKTLPFRMEIECEDAMPTMQATACVYEKGLKTQVLVDEETGKSKVSVSLSLAFSGEAYYEENVVVVKDAFSTQEVLEIERKEICYLKPCGVKGVSGSISGRSAVQELPLGVNLFATAGERLEIISTEITSSKIKVTGIINTLAYFCNDGEPFVRKLEAPFEKEFDLPECQDICSSDIVAKVERSSARLISATEIELEAELSLTIYPSQKVCFNVVIGIKSVGEKTENSHAISVYIPLENEELWSLSKRLNVCPDTLVATNPDLTFPLTGTERIVVYRKR